MSVIDHYRENVINATGCSCVKGHTLHTNSDQNWWIQTRQWEVGLFTSACPLGAGAFKYNVRGSDTMKRCRRWSGTLTFSDTS